MSAEPDKHLEQATLAFERGELSSREFLKACGENTRRLSVSKRAEDDLADFARSGYYHCRGCGKNWQPGDRDEFFLRCPRCGNSRKLKYHPPV